MKAKTEKAVPPTSLLDRNSINHSFYPCVFCEYIEPSTAVLLLVGQLTQQVNYIDIFVLGRKISKLKMP